MHYDTMRGAHSGVTGGGGGSRSVDSLGIAGHTQDVGFAPMQITRQYQRMKMGDREWGRGGTANQAFWHGKRLFEVGRDSEEVTGNGTW